MHRSLPEEFINGFSREQRGDAESWWDGLPEATRSDVYVLLDTRIDSRAFVFAADEQGHHEWRTLPIVDDAIEVDTCDDDDEAWITELSHYRLDHDEFVMASDMKVRTFHICSQHPAAGEVLAGGRLDSDFRCPADEAHCPIRPDDRSGHPRVPSPANEPNGLDLFLTDECGSENRNPL